jgi:hypothetical protein
MTVSTPGANCRKALRPPASGSAAATVFPRSTANGSQTATARARTQTALFRATPGKTPVKTMFFSTIFLTPMAGCLSKILAKIGRDGPISTNLHQIRQILLIADPSQSRIS